MKLEEVTYEGWDAYRLTNDVIELIVTQSIGPRVIRFGFVGGINVFKEYPETLGHTGGDEWHLYGGHRFWHAPEHPVRTYVPDNAPVTVSEIDGGMQVTQPVELATGMEKQLDITLNGESGVRVVHRLFNRGLWDVRVAAWGLSVMAAGGVGIIPLPPRGEHPRDLLPSNNITLWPYTRMNDPRWNWGTHYILLRQDVNGDPQKIGVSHARWAGYLREKVLFFKRAQHQPSAGYPDMNSLVEMFTNADMLEVETLSPLTTLAPEGFVEHVEEWYLAGDVPDVHDDASASQHVESAITRILDS